MNLEALFLGNRRRISGTVYGTIVVLAAITGSAKAVEPNLWSVAVIASVTSGLLWVAHVYSHGLGESVTIGRRLTAAEHPRIEIRCPAVVTGLVRNDAAPGVRIVGVRLGDGRDEPADVVIDAGGRGAANDGDAKETKTSSPA